jgi:hypothetical protein
VTSPLNAQGEAQNLTYVGVTIPACPPASPTTIEYAQFQDVPAAQIIAYINARVVEEGAGGTPTTHMYVAREVNANELPTGANFLTQIVIGTVLLAPKDGFEPKPAAPMPLVVTSDPSYVTTACGHDGTLAMLAPRVQPGSAAAIRFPDVDCGGGGTTPPTTKPTAPVKSSVWPWVLGGGAGLAAVWAVFFRKK